MRIVGRFRVRRIAAIGAVLTILTGIGLQSALILSGPAGAASARASGTGTAISYTLQGCRGSTADYIGGTFVCDPSKYTTGNLGKNWNELDQVPLRVILDAGATHPQSETFSFVAAVDQQLKAGGAPGFDGLSGLTLNAALSGGSCPALTSSPPATASPGIGGTFSTLYREVTVSNLAPGARCVYDFTARLAQGSSQNAGSSLHVNLADSQLRTKGIGARELSINPGESTAPPTTTTTTTTVPVTTTTTTTTVPVTSPTTAATTTTAPVSPTTQPRTNPGGATTTTQPRTSPTTHGTAPGPTTSVPHALAFTGRNSGEVSGVAVGLILAGLGLLATSRMRRRLPGERD